MKPSAFKGNATATGVASSHIPSGAECDEIMALIRLGMVFRAQHTGKRPGPLAHLIFDCAKRAGPPHTFARLLDELELAAARRELDGPQAAPIEKVDRVWQIITIHTKKGREQISFGTVRNHFTKARKILLA